MDYAAARQNMVDNQIRTNQVTDGRVIAALSSVPREMFVPKQMRGIAYVDDDIEIAQGRFLMEPMVLARLLQVAEIAPSDVVLDIGCGPGYSAAILAQLASTVIALESDPDLVARATQALIDLKVDNAAVAAGPLDAGYPQQAPYNVIVFDGAASEVPQAICNQLADGGRLLAVVSDGRPGRQGNATMFTRTGNSFGRRIVFDAAAPLLPGFAPKPSFVF